MLTHEDSAASRYGGVIFDVIETDGVLINSAEVTIVANHTGDHAAPVYLNLAANGLHRNLTGGVAGAQVRVFAHVALMVSDLTVSFWRTLDHGVLAPLATD